MGFLKTGAVVILRVLMVVFMLTVVLTAGYIGWGRFENHRLEAAVGKTKGFGPDPLLLANPVLAALRAKCSDGQLHFIVAVYPTTDQGLHQSLLLAEPEYAKGTPKLQDEFRAYLLKEKGGFPHATGPEKFDQVLLEIREFTVKLRDHDGFQMVQFSVSAHQFTKILGLDRKPESFVAEGSVPCDRRPYSRVESWMIQWTHP